jgi:hypothetical protein
MFAVTQSQVKLAVRLGQASAAARIPLVITPPLRVEQLELIIAKPLKGLGIEIVDGLDGAVVQVVAPVEVLEDGPIAGSVGVRLRGSDDSDGFYLTVVPGSRFVIAPEILTLTSSPDEAFVVGEAVLKMAPSPNQPSDKLDPTIQAVIVDEVFDVRVERIPSTATFRLRLECPRSRDCWEWRIHIDCLEGRVRCGKSIDGIAMAVCELVRADRLDRFPLSSRVPNAAA